ncbi:MAG: hypothetical protein KDB86_08670 [Actinobacteria bacterium]|nr:hypothetical protein [Actinomycetota bacterium]
MQPPPTNPSSSAGTPPIQEIADILPLGTIDYDQPGNEIDPSDKDDELELRSVQVKGMFLPDALATFSAGGTDYLATEANTGTETELTHTGRSTGLLLLAGLLLAAAGTLMAYPRRDTSPIHGDEL